MREPLQSPRACAFRVAANPATDHGRRGRHRRESLDRAAPNLGDGLDPGNPEKHCEEHERVRRVAWAMERLPPRCREVFRLRKIEQLPQAEIARRMEVSQRMVERHLRRALAQCREALDD